MTIANNTTETTTTTIATLVDGFSVQLTERATVVNARIAEIDVERNSLLAEVATINRTLAALKGKPVAAGGEGLTPTGRKPMSEEGRNNIRLALLARRERLAGAAAATETLEARKDLLAAEAAGTEAEAVVVPSEATQEPEATPEVTAPAPAKAKKGAKNVRG